MKVIGLWFLTGFLIAMPSLADARDYGRLYTTETLRRANAVYSPNITGLLFEDIAANLLDDERESLRRVHLQQPSDRTLSPLEFSANPTTGALLVPTFSVKFLDDLAIATAWFESRGCRSEAIIDYMAALSFGEMDLASPLPALAVPENAYELDKYVDDVSQKILKSALAFILLHELGHIHYRHRSYGGISAEQARAQERESDQFAMRVLKRMRVPPLGMVLWFMAAGVGDPLVNESRTATHPLSARRLRLIGQTLRDSPTDFIHPDNRATLTPGTIRATADEIEKIGAFLFDPDFRAGLRDRGRRATKASLAKAC